MRLIRGCACIAAWLVLPTWGASAQSRSAAMTVSVTVVRSTATAGEDGAAAPSSTIIPPGTAEKPTPAPPHETETEVVITPPSATEAATSVMMVTINY